MKRVLLVTLMVWLVSVFSVGYSELLTFSEFEHLKDYLPMNSIGVKGKKALAQLIAIRTWKVKRVNISSYSHSFTSEYSTYNVVKREYQIIWLLLEEVQTRKRTLIYVDDGHRYFNLFGLLVEGDIVEFRFNQTHQGGKLIIKGGDNPTNFLIPLRERK